MSRGNLGTDPSARGVRARPAHGLSARAAGVLHGVVLGYLRTGEPVGSRSAAKHARLEVSSATVRVEMSHLGDAGLLSKPHASAGRVPTRAGFRVYVDHLMRPKRPSAEARDGLARRLKDASDDVDALLRVASRQLSAVCTLAAIGRRPRLERTTVRRIQLLSLDADRLMAVLVLGDGMVRNRVVRLERGVSQVELLRAQSLFNKRWAGRPLDDVRGELRAQIEVSEGPARRLLELTERVLPEGNLEDAVIVEGRGHLLDAGAGPEVLSALEDTRLLLSVLDEVEVGQGTRVVFADEADAAAPQGLTVVGAAYGIDDRTLGTVAIVGSLRMNYARVVPWVGYTAEMISGLLRRDGTAA